MVFALVDGHNRPHSLFRLHSVGKEHVIVFFGIRILCTYYGNKSVVLLPAVVKNPAVNYGMISGKPYVFPKLRKRNKKDNTLWEQSEIFY